VTTFNLALSLHKRGDEAAAVEQYQKAITLQPEDASFRKALAISFERLQKPADAAPRTRSICGCRPMRQTPIRYVARISELTGA